MKRALLWASQIALAGLLVVFVWQRLSRDWSRITDVPARIVLGPGWIAGAFLVTLVTFGLLIFAWMRVLRGWDQELDFRTGARIWLVSNLGRYFPGKIWSIAGMAVLSEKAGVSGWAATASALVMQALSLGTGVALAAFLVPGVESLWRLGLSLLIASATVAALSYPPVVALGGRLLHRDIRPLSVGPLLQGLLSTGVAWAAYGVAFWLLARGLLGATGLSLLHATGVFTAGYIVGLVALFAPGGVGVREVVFIGLLAGPLGEAGAVVLSVGSRILLTLAEVVAALLAVVLKGKREDKVV